MGMLTILIALPLLGMLIALFLPGRNPMLFRWLALGISIAQLGLFLGGILPQYQATDGDFRLVEQLQWIRLDLGAMGQLNIEYHLGMDGMSLVLVLLSVIIFPIAALSSFSIQKRVKAYFSLFLLLNASVIGVFLALDFFLFYIFYEFMLLPMFFLIGLWGGARREYAAIKFFLYTLFGSVFMLLIMVGLAFSFTDPELSSALGQPVFTFDMLHMMGDGSSQLSNLVSGSLFDLQSELLGMNARHLAFWVLLIGFLIKVPSVPFHTWLPDAHVQAPTPISVILAGILLKVGGYGIIRICYGIFPDSGFLFANWTAVIGTVSILYGALVAMAQKDLKSLIAYSSVSHMGFVLLGIAGLNATGLNGAVFQMFNHGIVSAALFLIVGVLYDRTHDRQIAHYRGLWNVAPRFTVVVIISFFASLGLPGLNSFVSEMLVLFGAFNGSEVPPIVAGLAVLGILLGAVYFLRTFRSMFFGDYAYSGPAQNVSLKDLKPLEYLVLLPLVALMILFGIFPSLVLDLMDASVTQLASQLYENGRDLLYP